MSSPHTPSDPNGPKDPMPPGIHNVYIFEVFNTASWSVVLGAPMLLFLQHLNASATIVAIAACLSPTLNILQIPAARFVERVGYRRFVLSGWTTRSIFVLAMAVVAFLPEYIDHTVCVMTMLGLSFIYNVLRGISVCGMLPWFTHIVPESRRGEFLAKDQLAGALSAIGCLFISASLMKIDHAWYSYGIVFSIASACAFASLIYLRRVPDVPVEKIVANETPMPWKEMLLYPPFFKYLRYNMIINMALGASGVFWVRYFRTFLDVREANVLYVACLSTMVLACGLFMVGPLIDRAGNKPALGLSGILFALHFGVWGLVAAGVIPRTPTWLVVVLCLQTIPAGLAGALWNLANVRTIMGIVPAMGRPHFLALYSVVSNLTVGLVPLAWGPVMDSLSHWKVNWGFWQWNCFSLLYFTLMVTILCGLRALKYVTEPKLMTWDTFMHALLVETPSRGVTRLIGRIRGLGIG